MTSTGEKKYFPIPLCCTLGCICIVTHIQQYNSIKNVYPVPEFRWALEPLLEWSSKAQDLLQKMSQPSSYPTITQFVSNYLENIGKSVFEIQWPIFTAVTESVGICNSYFYYRAGCTFKCSSYLLHKHESALIDSVSTDHNFLRTSAAAGFSEQFLI